MGIENVFLTLAEDSEGAEAARFLELPFSDVERRRTVSSISISPISVMDFLLNRKKAGKVCDGIYQSLAALEASTSDDEARARHSSELESKLETVRVFLLGASSDAEVKQADRKAIFQKLCSTRPDFVDLFLNRKTLKTISFESRKIVVVLFTLFCEEAVLEFGQVALKPRATELVTELVVAMKDDDLLLPAGAALRASCRYDYVTAVIFNPDFALLDMFFTHFLIGAGSVELAVDPYRTFSSVLMTHKQQTLTFLEENYDAFFERFNVLLVSDNYVARRQSLKLLSDIILDRDRVFFSIMIRYIEDKENLKRIMTVMRTKSQAIQMEAFHVFKVFVAYQQKKEPQDRGIVNILVNNREKLVPYLVGLFYLSL